jgi:hypothetical protein
MDDFAQMKYQIPTPIIYTTSSPRHHHYHLSPPKIPPHRTSDYVVLDGCITDQLPLLPLAILSDHI